MFTYLSYNPNVWVLASSYSISIDIEKRALTVYSNGRIYKEYAVAVGKPNSTIPTSKINYK